jgi:hypothetical protein
MPIERIRLTAQGTPSTFFFAYTVKGGSQLHFSTNAFPPIYLPRELKIRLWFDIQGYPAQASSIFKISANHWNDVKCKRV